MAFLIFEVLSGFEIAGMTEIGWILKDVDDGRTSPLVRILDLSCLPETDAELLMVKGGDLDHFIRENLRDLVWAFSIHRHREDTLHDGSRNRINDPLVFVRL